MGIGQAKIPTEIEEKIYELYDQNMKIRDIANELNIGLSTAQRYTARYKKELEEAEKILNGALGEDKEDKQSNKVEELEKVIQEQEEQIKTIENTADEFSKQVDELKEEIKNLKMDIIDWQNIMRVKNETIANLDKEISKYKKYKKLFKSCMKLIKGLE